MQGVEHTLIRFFESAARKDKDVLQKLTQQKFRVDQGRWYFTLPDLYEFLTQQDAVFSGIDFKRFRQLIFNSAINKTVKRFGAEVTIADNRAKVDQSVYALVWHTED